MNVDKVLHIIIRDFVSHDGHFVDYRKLQKLPLWKDHIEGKKVLVADNGILKGSEAEKKAFFINLYNFLIIYAVTMEQPLPSEVVKVSDFFDHELCIIAGNSFSLNDILHGVLRSNKPHPSSNSPFFQGNSPKRSFCLKSLDPRVLFAVNSADISSPALRFYKAQTLESDLNAVVKNFLGSVVRCSSPGRSVVIPRLFLWYRKDFPGGHDVATARWIASFLSEPDATELTKLIDDLEIFGGVRIVHDSYDWRLNNSG